MRPKDRELIYCAGGLVWREEGAERQLLLIRAVKDGAWKLPKGHIDPEDESWMAAAKREVLEETGFESVITDFAGYTRYEVGGVPKIVLYWHMTPVDDHTFQPNEEIVEIAWVAPNECIERLTYPVDREFIAQFLTGIEPDPIKTGKIS